MHCVVLFLDLFVQHVVLFLDLFVQRVILFIDLFELFLDLFVEEQQVEEPSPCVAHVTTR